ncbi:MAG: hypothetical protein ABF575_00135 [Liquorilactobacillus hordei]|uniref:hypothetical protein n=1 Tax=Liquorilactobacillus hordei TaxID=468911 RepID=UPI0039E8ED45
MNENKNILSKYEERANEHIFLDGIVDEQCYKDANLKILIILKAGYSSEGEKMQENYSLTDFLATGAKGKDKRGVWAIFPKWLNIVSPTDFNPTMEKSEILKKIAVINIKKVPDMSSKSNNKDIVKAAEKYEDLIVQQIENINPDLIFSATLCKQLNEKVLKHIFKNHDEKKLIDNSNNFFEYFHYELPGKKILVLNSYHPAAWQYEKKKEENLKRISKMLPNLL